MFRRRQISEHPHPGQLYSMLMDLIVRFAHSGLIHGDFNEFNILVTRKTGEAIVIDFPQMVSTSHANAEWYVSLLPSMLEHCQCSVVSWRYFNRDVECIRTFFRRRFRYESSVYPRFKATVDEAGEKSFRLDIAVAASGFKNEDQQILEDVGYEFPLLSVRYFHLLTLRVCNGSFSTYLDSSQKMVRVVREARKRKRKRRMMTKTKSGIKKAEERKKAKKNRTTK